MFLVYKKLLCCFFTGSFILTSFAQEKLKLWNDNPTQREKWSELTVFLPEKHDTSGISVIICPGGSYYWLDMNNEGYSVARYLNSRGITAFVLHYRTARHGNQHPAMIQDLQRSMQIVKENAADYKINPEKVGIIGFSAGGHLAGTAAEYFDTDFIGRGEKSFIPAKPYFAAMIYPVVSMEDSICHKKSRKNLLGKNHSLEAAKMMSLEKNVRPDMPPIFFLHCTGDKTVDYRNSIIMDKTLTDKNVPHKFLLLDENGRGGHGFGIKPNGKATGWIDEFLKWLQTINN
jgi:acetyl esterase/lipase